MSDDVMTGNDHTCWYHFCQQAEIANLRAEVARLRGAVERLYFAAHWHADRHVDAVKLWSDVRDAAGIEPGQTAARVGADRGCAEVARLRALIEEAEHTNNCASWDEANDSDVADEVTFKPCNCWKARAVGGEK